MGIRLTMALVSEGQEGNLGDDWKYELETKIFCKGMLGDTTVSVPKHNLKPGTVMEPYSLTRSPGFGPGGRYRAKRCRRNASSSSTSGELSQGRSQGGFPRLRGATPRSPLSR